MLDPLSLVLSRALDEDGELAEIIEGRIANIFFIFSQAENHVKEMVAERTVLHSKFGFLGCHLQLLTVPCRSIERIAKNEPSTSGHHVEVHQEPVHALNHSRFTTEL